MYIHMCIYIYILRVCTCVSTYMAASVYAHISSQPARGFCQSLGCGDIMSGPYARSCTDMVGGPSRFSGSHFLFVCKSSRESG